MPDLYQLPLSAPCRAAMLTIKAVGADINLKVVNLMKKEQMKPEFLALNPQHCVPTFVDGSFVLWESRAICCYIASKYGKDDSLYPKDLKTRATVDRLLQFDIGTLFYRFGLYAFPVLFRGEKPDPEKLESLQESVGLLNGFLEGHNYAVGNNITVADHSLVATVTTIEALGADLSKHKNVVAWLARCKANMPGYAEANEAGVKDFANFAKGKFTA